MFKKDIDVDIHEQLCDSNGRYIMLDLSVKSQRLTLVSLYGYNTDEHELFNNIFQNILYLKNSSVILCGDWNFVQEKDLDTFNILHDRHTLSRKVVQD